MKNYIKARIENIDNSYLYLSSYNKGYYFNYLSSDEIGKLDKEIRHTFYIANFKTEFEEFEIVFLNMLTRNLFKSLIKVKTVGLKTALYLLDNYTYGEITLIVKEFDVEKLALLKNIGVYTARLIIESLQQEWFDNKITDKKDRVVTSLIKLGFKQKDILKAINKVDNKLSVENMIKTIIGEIHG